jgi:HK97 family phage major capsid protein
MANTLTPPGNVSEDEVTLLMRELAARKAGGERAVLPEGTVSSITSASHKQMGADALLPEDGKHSAMFMGWKDPSTQLSPAYRERMLTKSLKDAKYPFACPWSEMGDFLQAGWRSHSSGRRQEFIAQHADTFKGMQDTHGFFKARGMSTLGGEDGGFLLNPEISPTIESLFVQNDLASRVDTIPTSATHYNYPRCKDLNRNDGTRLGGVQHHWIDEADPAAESRPKLAFTEIKMRKLAIFVFMTTEIMNDTPYAVEQFVRNAVKEEINFALARAIMWGDGVNEPHGFANSAAVIDVAEEASQDANTFLSANALNMSSRMWRNSAGSAIWLHHQSVIPEIGKMTIGNFPVTVNIQNGGLAGPVTSTLLNRPLIESELCAPLGSLGDVWYVDLKQYKAITQSLVREDISIHVEFLTDQQCLRFIVRFGGRPLLPSAITPFKAPGAASDPPTQSSFIRMGTRS